MIADARQSRRGFIAGVLGMGGVLLLPKGIAAAKAEVLAAKTQVADSMTQPGKPQLLLFDPQRADACRWAAAGECGRATQPIVGGRAMLPIVGSPATQPIVGDRVRFARNLLSAASAPETIAGLSDYADFILLSGCAAEAGYRLVSERIQPTAAGETARGALVYWIVARRRAPTSG